MQRLQLWTDEQFSHFFLVPIDLGWPSGPDSVFDVLGTARAVQLESLLPFSVSSEEAQRWAEQTQQRIELELDAGTAAPPPSYEALIDQVRLQLDALGQAVDAEQARAFCHSLGLDYDRLAADSDAFAELWSELITTALRALDPKQQKKVIPAMAKVLKRHGYPEAARKLKKAPQTLRPFVTSLLEKLEVAATHAPPLDELDD